MMSSQYPTKKELWYRFKDAGAAQREWEKLQGWRRENATELPLFDSQQQPFYVVMTQEISNFIAEIDEIGKSPLITHVQNYLSEHGLNTAFADESYYSSKIEGAYSTRRRAREVIAKQNAETKSEKMILNNHAAMAFILNDKPIINAENFIRLQKIITSDVIDPQDVSEGYRTDEVLIQRGEADVAFVPPDHTKVSRMMEDLFRLIGTSDLHPLVVASVVHFYIGFVHPFFDGNGRTARATMYWYLMCHGYDFFRFFSISSKYEFERSAYYKAFLDTEEHLDTTHFVLMNVRTIYKALKATVHQAKKHVRKQYVKRFLQTQTFQPNALQEKFIKYAVSVEGDSVHLSKKKRQWWPSPEDAKRDVQELVDAGLFVHVKEFKYRLNTPETLDTDAVSPETLEQILWNLILNDLPQELDSLSTHTTVEGISDVEIEGVSKSDDMLEVWGTGTVSVDLQYGSNQDVRIDNGSVHDDSFVFTYRLWLLDNETVDDYTLEVDTSPFYE